MPAFLTATLSPGPHTITTNYSGDSEFLAATSSTIESDGKTSTTTAAAAAPTSSVFGQSVTITATVSVVAPGAGTPTGIITFSDGSTTLGTVNLSNGSASLSTSALTVATHTITASYGGDGNFGPSSNPINVTVSQAATTTALVAAPPASIFGQAVTFTATVLAAAPGAGAPSGTVTFNDGSTVWGSTALNGSGVATFTTSSLSIASHTITASFSGDGSFLTSSSSAGESVSQATTTTTVTGPASSVVGQIITFTATVRAVAPGSGTPTGSATFLDGTTALGTTALSGGSATWTTSALSLGDHTFTVDYSGDGNFVLSNGSTSDSVGKADTGITVAGPSTSVAGQAVTFTATVRANAPGSGTPTGAVTFMDNGIPVSTAMLDGTGAATYSTDSLDVGSHVITVSYSGDSNFQPKCFRKLFQPK